MENKYMNIEAYLIKNFPTVDQMPSIYYQWDMGNHFSLGEEIYQFKEKDTLNLERFNTVYKQALTIFNELFDQDDDLFLVTNRYRLKGQQKTNKMNVYPLNLRDKRKLKKLRVKTYPYPFEVDESDEYEMQQFSLGCKVKDIRIEGLLKGAIHEDFPLKPRFGADSVYYPDIFFVNSTKDIIFFVYDDRGCEVIARTPDRLRTLYKKYYDWVDSVDWERIEKGLEL